MKRKIFRTTICVVSFFISNDCLLLKAIETEKNIPTEGYTFFFADLEVSPPFVSIMSTEKTISKFEIAEDFHSDLAITFNCMSNNMLLCIDQPWLNKSRLLKDYTPLELTDKNTGLLLQWDVCDLIKAQLSIVENHKQKLTLIPKATHNIRSTKNLLFHNRIIIQPSPMFIGINVAPDVTPKENAQLELPARILSVISDGIGASPPLTLQASKLQDRWDEVGLRLSSPGKVELSFQANEIQRGYVVLRWKSIVGSKPEEVDKLLFGLLSGFSLRFDILTSEIQQGK